MTEHTKLLRILASVPGIRADVEGVPNSAECEKLNCEYIVSVVCNDSNAEITKSYTRERRRDWCVKDNVAKIVNSLLYQWIEGENNYLDIAIDLLSAYRDEVNK